MQSRTFIRTLLADLFVFAILHGQLSFISFFFVGDIRPFLTALTLLAPFFALTVIRRSVERLSVFLGLHLLLCTWPLWIIIDPALNFFLFLFMLVSMLYSLVARLRGDWWPDKGITLVAVGLNALVALLLEYFGIAPPGKVLAFWAFVMMVCHLICNQTFRVDNTLELLSGMARQPVDVTLRFNNFILAVFLVPVAAASVAAALLPLDKAGKLLVDLLLSVYIFLNNLLMRLMSLLGSPEGELKRGPRPDLSGLLPEAREAPAWVRVVETVFTYLIWCAFAVLLIYGAFRGLHALYRQFYRGLQGEGEVREYIGPQLEPGKIRALLRGLRPRLPSFGKSREERIRRMYYRKVRRHIRRGAEVHPADTTGEIAERLRQRENVDDLTRLYDQARYNLRR